MPANAASAHFQIPVLDFSIHFFSHWKNNKKYLLVVVSTTQIKAFHWVHVGMLVSGKPDDQRLYLSRGASMELCPRAKGVLAAQPISHREHCLNWAGEQPGPEGKCQRVFSAKKLSRISSFHPYLEWIAKSWERRCCIHLQLEHAIPLPVSDPSTTLALLHGRFV